MDKIHYNTQGQNPSDLVHLSWLRSLGINEVKDLKILDLGCGSGYLCNKFMVDGARYVVGADIDRPVDFCFEGEALHFLPLDFNSSDWVMAMGRSLELNKFDLVLAFDIVEHLNAPSVFLKNINQLLEENGRLVLTTPNTNSWECFLFPDSWSGAKDPDHLTLFNAYSLRFILERTGFELEKMQAPINKLGPLAPLVPNWGGQLLSLSRKKP
ncbi:MAG: class I SAM-dependent methyltransferase [bacterium]|nr:class I SAM-dependent methyltransferase [bacterium]